MGKQKGGLSQTSHLITSQLGELALTRADEGELRFFMSKPQLHWTLKSQFYGELGGAKGSLPEVDQNLAGRERWDAVAGPPDDGYNWADGTAMLHASLIALLFSVLSLVGGCIMLRSLLVQPPERQGRNRGGPH